MARDESIELNEVQRAVAEHYCSGDFAYMTTLQEVEESGDTLFIFLIKECAPSEGCEDVAEAMHRVENSIHELELVVSGLQQMKPVAKVKP